MEEKVKGLLKREADLKVLCAGNTIETLGSATTDIQVDSGRTATARTTYGSFGTSRNYEACNQLMQVEKELDAMEEEIVKLYDSWVRWGQPLPTN